MQTTTDNPRLPPAPTQTNSRYHSMKIKRFVAADMRSAMNLVRKEHGPDAVILSNRRIAEGIEIVAASNYDEDAVKRALDASRPQPPPKPKSVSAADAMIAAVTRRKAPAPEPVVATTSAVAALARAAVGATGRTLDSADEIVPVMSDFARTLARSAPAAAVVDAQRVPKQVFAPFNVEDAAAAEGAPSLPPPSTITAPVTAPMAARPAPINRARFTIDPPLDDEPALPNAGIIRAHGRAEDAPVVPAFGRNLEPVAAPTIRTQPVTAQPVAAQPVTAHTAAVQPDIEAPAFSLPAAIATPAQAITAPVMPPTSTTPARLFSPSAASAPVETPLEAPIQTTVAAVMQAPPVSPAIPAIPVAPVAPAAIATPIAAAAPALPATPDIAEIETAPATMNAEPPFVVGPAITPAAAPAEAPVSAAPAAPAAATPALSLVPREDTQIARLRDEVAGMRVVIEREMNRFADERIRGNPVRATVLDLMDEYGFDAGLSRDVVMQIPADTEAHRGRGLMLGLISRRLPIAPVDPLESGGVIALVGPTGAGKTTTIAKLAARFAEKHASRDVALVTTDTLRVGAREQLYGFGRQLGVAVHEANSGTDLLLLLERLRDYKLVLIDTAGLGPRDRALAAQLQWLRAAEPVRSLLVLPANTSFGDMDEVVRRFSAANLQGVVLSKLDETGRFGTSLSVAVDHRLPITWVTDGQDVPDDLHRASAANLVLRLEDLRRAADMPSNPELNNAVA